MPFSQLVGAPEGARIRFEEDGLAWSRDDGVWRIRRGPVDVGLITRVRLELAAVHPDSDDRHVRKVA